MYSQSLWNLYYSGRSEKKMINKIKKDCGNHYAGNKSTDWK